MDIIDKHFIALPIQKKTFLAIISTGFLAVAIISFCTKLTSLLESVLIFIVGTLYSAMIKQQYRIEALENQKPRTKVRGTKESKRFWA